MWSLGCVIAELFLGWPLYPGASEYDQVRPGSTGTHCKHESFMWIAPHLQHGVWMGFWAVMLSPEPCFSWTSRFFLSSSFFSLFL